VEKQSLSREEIWNRDMKNAKKLWQLWYKRLTDGKLPENH
jgi:hypothetical protein